MPRVTLAVLAVAAAGCGLVAAPRPADPGTALISTTALAAHLHDADLVLLHVGQRAADYEAAHIPGARFLAYADIVVDGADDVGAELPPPPDLERMLKDRGVSDDSRVVVYGPTVLAARTFFTLDVAGLRRVSVLDGGLKAWQGEGRPVTAGQSPKPAARGTFTPRVDAARIASADWLRANASTVALVDVRPDPEYTGADGGVAGVHAPGHIDGARQLPWDKLVEPDGRFLSPDRLRARLAEAGATPGKPVVAYCMVGMRASVVYLVARQLGLDVRLYDGSIVDWTQRKLPTKMGR